MSASEPLHFQVPALPHGEGGGGRGSGILASVVFLVAALGLALGAQWWIPRSTDPFLPSDNAWLDWTNVLSVHLTFAPEQWSAMEPVGGFDPFGRSSGHPDDRPAEANRPGPVGGPGMPPFGLSMLLTPFFLQTDSDGDGALSSTEFSSLWSAWVAAWDTNHTGTLTLEKIRDGINTSFARVNPFGPDPGNGPSGGLQGAAKPPGEMRMPGSRGGGGPGNMLLGAEGKRNGLASAMGIEFPTARADLDIAAMHVPSVAVRYKGNGTFMASRNALKRSLKIDLNDFVPGRRLGTMTKLNLHTCVTDPSWMNEVLSHKLFRDAGVPAPRTAYARVELTVPGKFDRQLLGLYSIVENVDDNFALDRFGTKRGALFKPVTQRLFEDLGDCWADYRQIYDPKTSISLVEQQRVMDLCKLVSHSSDSEFAARIGDFLDLDLFARFMAVTIWLSTMDSILGVGQNFYVYLHPKTGQFQFIPWDLDHSFGQFGMVGTQEQREHLSINKPWDGAILFLDRVFKVDSFKKRYLATMQKFQRTIFLPERFHFQVDQLASILRPVIESESNSMARQFERVTRGQSPEPTAAAGFGPPGGFGGEVKPIKPFVMARAQSIADQLAGKSQGMQATRGGFFGGRGGPGRAGQPGGETQRGPDAPGGFGPGTFIGPLIARSLDPDQSGETTGAEAQAVLERWFREWNTDDNATLSDAELRAGIDKEFAPGRGGRMPGFGPPPGGFGSPP